MISIVIPVYNGERFLREAVDSVRSQSCSEWELIVVDDGSTDGTASVMTQYTDDNRIKFIQKENTGVTQTRWRGVEEATGEWVTFLDADDILMPDAVAIINRQLGGEVDILSFKHIPFENISDLSNSEAPQKENTEKISGRYKETISVAREILLGKMLSSIWSAVYRRQVLSQYKNLFCNGLHIAEDTIFNLELILATNPAVISISDKLYGYRNNSESIMHTISPQRFDAVKQALNYIDRFISRNPEIANELKDAIAFRRLLLWSTFMFHPDNPYYRSRNLRKCMRKLYFPAFSHLYPYLKVYLFIDLFISKKLTQWILEPRQ